LEITSARDTAVGNPKGKSILLEASGVRGNMQRELADQWSGGASIDL
jgi:hypothetical protein